MLALALLAVTAVAAVYALSERRLRAHFAVPSHRVTVPVDAPSIARGRHLAVIRGCVECHGTDLGGRVVVDEPLVGRIAGTNLTRGGRGASLGDEDWERAVRHGVRADGSALRFMPAHELAGMADDELGAIVAYVRSLPAVRRTPPATIAGPLGRLWLLTGDVAFVPAERVDHAAATREMTGVELAALWAYLRALPARPARR